MRITYSVITCVLAYGIPNLTIPVASFFLSELTKIARIEILIILGISFLIMDTALGVSILNRKFN